MRAKTPGDYCFTALAVCIVRRGFARARVPASAPEAIRTCACTCCRRLGVGLDNLRSGSARELKEWRPAENHRTPRKAWADGMARPGGVATN
jgi:hypothetical protein